MRHKRDRDSLCQRELGPEWGAWLRGTPFAVFFTTVEAPPGECSPERRDPMGLAANQHPLESREELAPFALAGISAGVLVCDPAGSVLYASSPLVPLLGGELRRIDSEAGSEGNSGGSIRGKFLDGLGEALRMEGPLDRLLTSEDDRRRALYLSVVPREDERGNRRVVAHLMDLSDLVGRGDLIADILRQVRHDLRGPL